MENFQIKSKHFPCTIILNISDKNKINNGIITPRSLYCDNGKICK